MTDQHDLEPYVSRIFRKTTKSVRAGSRSATKGIKTDDQLHLVIDSDNFSGPRHIRFLAIALIAYLPQALGLVCEEDATSEDG